MRKKLFEIESYVLNNALVVVELDNEQSVNIDREKFEKWLERSGRLEYSFEAPDHTGELRSMDGVMSIKSYWDEWDAYNDLYDYMIVHNVVDPFDVNESLKNILDDYSQE